MDTKEKKIFYKDLSHAIVGLAMKVHNKLGYGFLEKVYENAMMVQFRRKGIKAKQQTPLPDYFYNEVVGDYYADILLEDKTIIELKTAEMISVAHRAQTLNYLKSSGYSVGNTFEFREREARARKVSSNKMMIPKQVELCGNFSFVSICSVVI